MKVSILIPAYNVGPFIAKAIESALAQDYQDKEIIVVNDGSTDETGKVLSSFEGRIQLAEQPNAGPAAARNLALGMSTGEYVALLDGDDLWLPGRLRILVDYLDANSEITLMTSDAYLLRDRSPSDETYYQSRPRRLRFRTEDQSFWICQYNFVLGMVVARRSAFDKHGAFDESLRTYEDWDLWLRFICSGERAGIVDRPLAYYRRRRESLTGKPSATFRDEVGVLDRAMRRPESKQIFGVQGRKEFAEGKFAFSLGQHKEGARHFSLAARDAGLPMGTRLRARAAGLMPRKAARAYLRRADQDAQ